MRLFSLTLIFCAVFTLNLRAQNVSAVKVELTLDQEQFLSNEELRLGVRIINHSGQTLSFGKETDWLTFSIQARDNYVVSQMGEVPVVGEFSLESSLTGTKRVNLTPYFDFRQAGRYQVTATVKIPQWNKEITSQPKVFDVINGTNLKEFDFGIPLPANSTNAQPEMRKYILQQAIYLKQMKLYVRVTDTTGSAVHKVFPIAPMVSFSQPEAQVDQNSNLHVLSQIGARAFRYCMINPDGNLIAQKTYEYGKTRPVLRTTADGKISVAGGVQRISQSDLPPSISEAPKNDASSQKP